MVSAPAGHQGGAARDGGGCLPSLSEPELPNSMFLVVIGTVNYVVGRGRKASWLRVILGVAVREMAGYGGLSLLGSSKLQLKAAPTRACALPG